MFLSTKCDLIFNGFKYMVSTLYILFYFLEFLDNLLFVSDSKNNSFF